MQLIDRFKQDIGMGEFKKETYNMYKSTVSIFLNHIDKAEEDISLKDVQDFIRYLRYEKKLSIGTINNYRSGIKYLFEVTLDKGWNDRKVPRIRGYNPLPSVLDRNEVKNLINAVPHVMYKTVLSTIYSSGLRVREAVTLKCRDIDSKRMQIYVSEGKNSNARYTILSEKNLILLRDYVKLWKKRTGYSFAVDDYLFPSPYKRDRGKHISTRSIQKSITKAAKEANINKNATVHTLRHCFATHLLESGESLLNIKHLLGHNSIRSTCIYLHLVDVTKMGIKSPFDMEVPN